MAEPTPDTLRELATAPGSMSADGRSITERSADDVIKLDQHAARKEAASKSNGDMWSMLGRAQAVPPGST